MNAELYLSIMIVVCIITPVVSMLVHRKETRISLESRVRPDIDVDKMKEAEEKVSLFLRKNGIAPGTEIIAIGHAVNVFPGEDDCRLQSQAHLNEADEDGRMIVTFQKGLSERERIFAFAHECGHIVNGDPIPNDRPTGKRKKQPEQIVDYIAAALLMPFNDVYEYLSKNNYLKTTPRKRVRITKSLCKKYGVSTTLALRRIREVYLLKESEPKSKT